MVVDWSQFLTLAAGGIVAAAAGLAADRWRRRWDRDALRGRRSDEAAIEILGLLDAMADLFRGGSYGDGPDGPEEAELAAEIRRRAVELKGAESRAIVLGIVDVLSQWVSAQNMSGDRPRTIAWKMRSLAHETVRAVLDGDGLPSREELDRYLGAIEDDHALREESEAQWRREQREHPTA